MLQRRHELQRKTESRETGPTLSGGEREQREHDSNESESTSFQRHRLKLQEHLSGSSSRVLLVPCLNPLYFQQGRTENAASTDPTSCWTEDSEAFIRSCAQRKHTETDSVLRKQVSVSDTQSFKLGDTTSNVSSCLCVHVSCLCVSCRCVTVSWSVHVGS